jgi:DNA-binding NarL/FixJ family response regulator
MSRLISSASRKASARKPSRSGRFRVAIAGPELIADGLNSLLSSQTEMETLTPLPDLQQVIDFIMTMRDLHRPVDVVVLDWNGNAAYDDLRLQILSSLSRYQQACLVMLASVFPEEVEHIKQAGVRGYIFATSSFSQFAGAIRLLAGNKEATYFPALPEHSSARNEYANPGVSRHLVFRPERLDAYARTIGWKLTEKEVYLVRHFDCEINELAAGMNRPSEMVRHDLSQEIYQFLTLLSGKRVNKRFVAFQVLLEYGILEYVP